MARSIAIGPLAIALRLTFTILTFLLLATLFLITLRLTQHA